MKHYIFDKALTRVIKSEVLKWGILPSVGYLAMLGDTSDCHKWGSVLLVSNGKWVKDIATHAVKHRITPNNKELSGPKVQRDPKC